MTWPTLIEIFLLGIALSMDAFAVSIIDGLIYSNLNKRRVFFIAILFGLFQALMPLLGYFAIEGISLAVGTGGEVAQTIMGHVVAWLGFGLLLFVGIKMLVEAIISLRKEEKAEPREFSKKEVLYFAFATSIDALSSGVALHAGLSNNYTVFLHVFIIFAITFVFSLLGVIFGKKIIALLKGRYEIASLLGGVILILIAIWIVLAHHLGL